MAHWIPALTLTCYAFMSVGTLGFAADLVFEDDILPILVAKCNGCHGAQAKEANLDLRSVAGMLQGGDTGPAIVSENVDDSLLFQRILVGEMPPDGEPQLTPTEIERISNWIRSGAHTNDSSATTAWQERYDEMRSAWAFNPPKRPDVPGTETAERRDPILSPDASAIRPSLQAWYLAETIRLGHGERLHEWIDQSGNERHLKATWSRVDSQIGAPPRFFARGGMGSVPVVRFNDIAGMAVVNSDKSSFVRSESWTVIYALTLRPLGHQATTGTLTGFGGSHLQTDSPRPTTLIEIDRDHHAFSVSKPEGSDVFARDSLWLYYDRPIILSLVHEPDADGTTTELFVNGVSIQRATMAAPNSERPSPTGADLGIFIGRAAEWSGAIRGDLGEVIVYGTTLDADQRAAVENGLIEKYNVPHAPAFSRSPKLAGQAARPTEIHPIDAFITKQREVHGLSSAPTADRRVLIRRAYFDLIGLPPPPEAVQKFIDDTSPFAWERVLDQLLNSPHYGERWGRHWLDVARYADTGGYETDIYFRNAWRYRDYVVQSFNKDKPYDRFVQEQIAGDEIWPDNLDLHGSYVMDPEQFRHFEAHTATGFYALGTQIHESNMDATKLNYECLTDWVDTTASAFLGLTFACARCHDHKFDPLAQRDYYALQAIFASSRETEMPIQHGMGLADWKQHYPKLLRVEEARTAYQLFEEKTADRDRTDAEKEKLQQLKSALADAVLALPKADAQGQPYVGIYERPTVSVLSHRRPELTPAVHLLSRGEPSRPKQRMAPALPQILAATTGHDGPLASGLGSRAEFARWLTQPQHPLTARVMVNRIWHWHFGQGIVATPNDFGAMGTPPTHPELLDWMAIEFVNRGWSMKSMHRLIMSSRTYQQASDFFSDRHGNLDPENTLLWRMNRHRLEGESLWDAIHSVAGTINLELGGRPVMPPLVTAELTNKSNWVPAADPQQHTRRGIYILVRRNFRFPLFELFDAPVNAISCQGRDVSTVATQALWLLNNQLGVTQAQAFAARLVRDSESQQPQDWIRQAWQLAVCRPPTNDEVNESLQLIADLQELHSTDSTLDGLPPELAALPTAQAAALTKYCLAIFNLNEFIYVD